jgi:hypothetical protein
MTASVYESPFLSSSEKISLFATTLSQTSRLRDLVRDLWMFLAERPKPPPPRVDYCSIYRKSYKNSDTSSDDSSDEDPELEPRAETPSDSDGDDFDLEAEAASDDVSPSSALGEVSRNSAQRPSSGRTVRRYEFSLAPLIAPTSSWRTETPRMSLAVGALRRAVTQKSYLHSHATAILGHCTSLRSLHIASSKDALSDCLPALPPHQLIELTVSHPDRIFDWLQYGFSSVARLTIIDAPGGQLNTRFLKSFSNLTHLRTRLYADDMTLSALAPLEHLTHIWFMPTAAHGNLTLASFLSALPTTLERVRLDVALEAPPVGFADVDWESGAFPFVRVHQLAGSETSWRDDGMWMDKKVGDDLDRDHEEGGRQEEAKDGADMIDEDTDSGSEDCEDAEDAPELMFNIYTDWLRQCWSSRSTDGWDD